VRPAIFEPVAFDDHALLDSGGGEKLERYGPVVLRRPDPQAVWTRALDASQWERADLTFVRESDRGGRWEPRRGAHAAALGREPQWTISFAEGRFIVRPTPFKHVGLFPEQASNWVAVSRAARSLAERPRLLNLFGYTGVASILAAQAGCEVTHVDASKTSIAWTRENAQASGLAPDALRMVLDDALAYVRREVRRNARYHVVLLDPPHYGRGPKGEKWQFEDGVAPLVAAVREILDERALVILSTYAIGCTPLTLANLLGEIGPGEIEAGELALASQSGRALPAGFCARFTRGFDASVMSR
jgi:23S rRNA (cytosine1962-C5)-methyltransferase